MTVWHGKIRTTRCMVHNFKMKQLQQFLLLTCAAWHWNFVLNSTPRNRCTGLFLQIVSFSHCSMSQYMPALSVVPPRHEFNRDDSFFIQECKCYNFSSRLTHFLIFWRSEQLHVFTAVQLVLFEEWNGAPMSSLVTMYYRNLLFFKPKNFHFCASLPGILLPSMHALCGSQSAMDIVLYSSGEQLGAVDTYWIMT